MTWQSASFRKYFLRVVGNKSSAASYAVNLRKLDEYTGGLDEKIDQIGFEKIIEWAKGQSDGPFAAYPSNVRSALKRYVTFLIEDGDPDASDLISGYDQPIDAELAAVEATVFRYEAELQAAIRRQITTLEDGLKIADEGVERPVATGRIDILAEASSGEFVVIELKAGPCPGGALEQALGYTEDIASETGRPVRTILVASEFGDRIRSAARRVPSVKLISYKLHLAFDTEQVS